MPPLGSVSVLAAVHLSEVVVAPVRFIKTIGDAVMFVSPDTAALLDVVLAAALHSGGADVHPQVMVGLLVDGLRYGATRAGDEDGASSWPQLSQIQMLSGVPQ